MRRRKISLTTIALLIASIFICGGIIYFYSVTQPHNARVQKMRAQTIDYTHAHEEGFATIFTTIFHNAAQCENEHCRAKIRARIFEILDDSYQVDDFASTYFIRQGENNSIERLYLSGRWEGSPASSDSQLAVWKLLAGLDTSLPVSMIDRFTGQSKYLFDVPSYSEFIIPFVYEGHVRGALVRLAGK